MHVRSFAVDLVVDEDVSGGSDGKFASGSFETVREHSIIALQMNKKKVRGFVSKSKKSCTLQPLRISLSYNVRSYWSYLVLVYSCDSHDCHS